MPDPAVQIKLSTLLLQGGSGIFGPLSGIPGIGESLLDPELELPEKIAAVRESRRRSDSLKLSKVSIGPNPRDILSATSLQTGAIRAQAVCRISQYFDLKSFREFIRNLKKAVKEQSDNKNFDSKNKLKEIFLIPDQIIDDIFNRAFLPLDALEKINENELTQINPVPLGTGFLVGGTYLLTNHHVVPDKDTATQCVAQFNYIEDEFGNVQQSIDCEFNSERLFITEPKLDYTLVQLKVSSSYGFAGCRFGWLPIVEDDENVIPLDNLFIIHHPKGMSKKLDLNNNTVIEDGLFKNVLRYTADTDYGSSAAPVLNTEWQLVALHHAVPPKEQLSIERVQQGVRICRIAEDLKQKQSRDSNLQSFVENFVVPSECLNYPPLLAGRRFNGIDEYISIDSKVYFASCATNSSEDNSARFADQGVSTIKFWNSRGIELRSIPHRGVQKIEFSSDSKRLASSGSFYNAEVKLWNTETGDLIRVLSIDDKDTENWGKLQNVNSLSFQPASNLVLAVANIFGEVTLWDTNTGDWLNSQRGSLLISYPQLSDLKGSIVKFSPDGKFLAIANEEAVQLWQTSNWSLQKIEVDRSQTVCFSSNSQILVISIQDGFFQFFDLETSVLSEKIRADDNIINQIEFISVNGSFKDETLLTFGSEGFVRFWSLDGHLIKEITLDPEIAQRGIQSTSFSPDGKTLIIVGLSTEISVVNIETQEIKTIKHFKQTMQQRGADFPYADVKFNPHALPTGFTSFAAMETTQSFTVEAWINSDVNGGGAIFDLTLEFTQGRSGKFVLSITPQNDVSGSLKTSLSGARGITSESGVGEVLLGKFNHVAAVVEFQEDSEKVTCYVNGRSTGESSSSSSQAIICEFSPRLQVIGTSLESADFAPSLSNFFKGIISEIRLWNTARTSEQLVGNMYRPLIAQESGLIGYWKFEEGLGNKIFNLSSNSEDYGLTIGTKRLTTHQLPFFPFPVGLSFSETGHYVNCGNAPNLNTEQITVEAWIKHQYGNCLIVNRGFSSKVGYALIWHDSKIRVILKDDSSTDKITIVDARNSIPQDHVWHHIAFTWDNSSSEISLYLDGRLQDSIVIQGRSKTITSAGKSLTFGLFTGDLNNLAADLLIGHKENENGNAKKKMYYDVKIAEVRLWSVVRSQDQIKSNMARRLSNRDVDWEDLTGYWRLDNCEQNGETRNLKSDSSPGVIHGASLFPLPCIPDTKSS